MRIEQLRASLASLDEFLELNAPEAYGSLKRGATEHERRRLAERLFGGKTVPPAIDTWFSWHNGQSLEGPALLPGYDLSPFHLGSVRDAIESHRSWESVRDHGELTGDWNPHWLPIFEGEFGDNLVLETAGRSKGVIRAVWHETTKREVVAADLLELVARIKRAWRKERQPSRRKVKTAATVAVPCAWTDAPFELVTTPPTARSLAEERIGTAYLIGPSGKVGEPFHELFVKLAPKVWGHTAMCGPLEECWEWLRNDTLGPVRRWAKSDAAAAEELLTAMQILKHQVRRRMTEFDSA